MNSKEWGGTQFLNIVEQHENEIVYFAQKLGLYNQFEGCYQEGLYGLWEAYESFDSVKDGFSTWANTKVKCRMKHHLCQNSNRFQECQLLSTMIQLFTRNVSAADNSYHWSTIQQKLTVNQWKWLYYHIVLVKSMHQTGEEEI